ncbi:unnamed protein product [Caretta caretta]
MSTFLSTLDPHECLVLSGDFNTVLDMRDCIGKEKCQATTNVIKEIVDHHSLVEVCHDYHPDNSITFTYVQVEYTWLCLSQLDCFYVPRFNIL